MTESPKAGPSTRMSRVGRHLSTSGGLKNTLRLTREQELEALQIFLFNPQGWARAATTSPTLTMVAIK
jgi:endonuclease IV